MKRQSKADKAIDKRIETIYYRNCSGIQINIMDIPRVFAEGRKAIAEGADDTALTAKIVAFVESIRHN
jgi:hypothetical protein